MCSVINYNPSRRLNLCSHHVVRRVCSIVFASVYCCAQALFLLFHNGGDTLLVGCVCVGMVVTCHSKVCNRRSEKQLLKQ